MKPDYFNESSGLRMNKILSDCLYAEILRLILPSAIIGRIVDFDRDNLSVNVEKRLKSEYLLLVFSARGLSLSTTFQTRSKEQRMRYQQASSIQTIMEVL